MTKKRDSPIMPPVPAHGTRPQKARDFPPWRLANVGALSNLHGLEPAFEGA